MKKVMMLGAGGCQLNGIKRIRSLGYEVVVSDYKEDSPGKCLADYTVLADAFSYEETLQGARQYEIDGIMTSGTDQPVLIVNQVAEALNLPMFLGANKALKVTNKKYMKETLSEYGIPTVNYRILRSDFKDGQMDGMIPPFVIKPLDSQGQRGIYKVDTLQEIRDLFHQVLAFSRVDEILVEDFYPNKEITVSGWVDRGECRILTVTDRVTFHSDEHIGVCLAHEYPSIHLNRYREDIFRITEDICRAFKIQEGPIYYQYLVGDSGVLVNEIACRIGGAYEDVTIPMITGVDILKMNIEGALNEAYDKMALNRYRYTEEVVCMSTQLFFCKSGTIAYMTPREEMLALDCVVDLGYNFSVGDMIGEIENASQRAGYIIIRGDSEDQIKANIHMVFEKLAIRDGSGENLILKGKRWYRDEA